MDWSELEGRVESKGGKTLIKIEIRMSLERFKEILIELSHARFLLIGCQWPVIHFPCFVWLSPKSLQTVVLHFFPVGKANLSFSSSSLIPLLTSCFLYWAPPRCRLTQFVKQLTKQTIMNLNGVIKKTIFLIAICKPWPNIFFDNDFDILKLYTKIIYFNFM